MRDFSPIRKGQPFLGEFLSRLVAVCLPKQKEESTIAKGWERAPECDGVWRKKNGTATSVAVECGRALSLLRQEKRG